MTQADANPAASRAQRVIEAIRPAVQADGGDLEFVDATADGVVRIRMHGACVQCPSSDMTLTGVVEKNLREYVPGFQRVERLP